MKNELSEPAWSGYEQDIPVAQGPVQPAHNGSVAGSNPAGDTKPPFIPHLKTALMNATYPSYGVHADCPKCGEKFVQDVREWFLLCGNFEHAKAILDAARAYAELQKTERDQRGAEKGTGAQKGSTK